jgi:hypothetical protein
MKKKPETEDSSTVRMKSATDLLLTLWVLLTAVAYYGPVIDPALSRSATVLAPVYALMVLLSVLSISLKYSRSRDKRRSDEFSARKSEK